MTTEFVSKVINSVEGSRVLSSDERSWLNNLSEEECVSHLSSFITGKMEEAISRNEELTYSLIPGEGEGVIID